uniref:Uncharacterized protein n=1 Tax=Lactuca sativa TaxID=4236 RepID=A0A9R1VTL5_LACSA|nr:hypothetical protein LSAT_V11C400207880 [Lactuca sativa]
MDASSSPSISSKQNVEFQPENPCYCWLPSRNEGPKCKFWEWLQPETLENEVSSRKDQKELCNLTLKISTLKTRSAYMEQENMVVRQDSEKKKNKWKLFTHKVLMIEFFLLFVFKM